MTINPGDEQVLPVKRGTVLLPEIVEIENVFILYFALMSMDY